MIIFDSSKPFFKGNLHTHTSNSDGRLAPEEVEALYRENGYDFLALTDHWKVTCEEHMNGGMLVLPGIEFDYNLAGEVVHIVGIGVDSGITGRVRHGQSPLSGIGAIRVCGGEAILAHPAWSLNTPVTISALTGVCAAEIYNTVSGTPWNGDRADSTNILDIAAAHGTPLNTVASDDAHFYNGDECRAAIMGQPDALTREGILAMLRSGRWYSTTGPRITSLELNDDSVTVTVPERSDILFLSDRVYSDYRCQRDVLTATYPLESNVPESYIRVIVIGKDGKRAWCNPIKLR